MEKTFKVRCYAIPKAGLFYAGCITLNLSSTGNSLEEAKNNLDKIIDAYCEVAAKGHEYKDFGHLLKRKAPAFMYLEYLFCWIMFSMSKTQRFFTFEEKLPLTVCYQK